MSQPDCSRRRRWSDLAESPAGSTAPIADTGRFETARLPEHSYPMPYTGSRPRTTKLSRPRDHRIAATSTRRPRGGSSLRDCGESRRSPEEGSTGRPDNAARKIQRAFDDGKFSRRCKAIGIRPHDTRQKQNAGDVLRPSPAPCSCFHSRLSQPFAGGRPPAARGVIPIQRESVPWPELRLRSASTVNWEA